MADKTPETYADLVEQYDGLAHDELARSPEVAAVYASLAGAWATMELAAAVDRTREPAPAKPAPAAKDRPKCEDCRHSYTQHYNEGPCRVTRCECPTWVPSDE